MIETAVRIFLCRLFYLLPAGWRIRLRKRAELLYYRAGYGDTLMVGAVAREIKRAYGNVTVTVNGVKESLLRYNPYIDAAGQRYSGIDLNYHYGRPNAGAHLEKNLIDVMCGKVGIKNPKRSLDIYLDKEEEDYAESIVGRLARPIITIQTSSGDFDSGRKRWPDEYWEELSLKLNNAGYTVLHLGDTEDTRIKGTVNLLGKQNIRKSIAVVKRADLHIGTVSSLMHGAAAAGTPSVIIYGGFERYSAHGYGKVRPIESRIECSPCIETNAVIPPCPYGVRCMKEITPDTVYSAVTEIINKTGAVIHSSREALCRT